METHVLIWFTVMITLALLYEYKDKGQVAKRLRQIYKLNDRVLFQFAGGHFTGIIIEANKTSTMVKYTTMDAQGYKYPVDQDKILKKITQ